MDREQIVNDTKTFIMEKFLPDEDPANLEPSTAMVTRGILDSLATLEVVSFLEDQYQIKIAAHEVSIDNMDSLDKMADLVLRKKS